MRLSYIFTTTLICVWMLALVKCVKHGSNLLFIIMYLFIGVYCANVTLISSPQRQKAQENLENLESFNASIWIHLDLSCVCFHTNIWVHLDLSCFHTNVYSAFILTYGFTWTWAYSAFILTYGFTWTWSYSAFILTYGFTWTWGYSAFILTYGFTWTWAYFAFILTYGFTWTWAYFAFILTYGFTWTWAVSVCLSHRLCSPTAFNGGRSPLTQHSMPAHQL